MAEWSPFRAYAQKRASSVWINIFTAGILCAGIVWYFLAARRLPGYFWNWHALLNFLIVHGNDGHFRPGLLLQGLFTTLRVGFWTFVISLVLGSILGIIAVNKSFPESLPYQLIINIIRNTPPIILLFCVYFLTGNVFSLAPLAEAVRQMPQFIQNLISLFVAPQNQYESMFAAVLALGLYQSAYVAEIVRGSIESVPQGQWDAAKALGFSRLAASRFIIIPQSLRLAVPPLTGQCISTFKESSLASLISLPDLTFQSLEIMATSGMTFEIWLCSGALYLLLGFFCASIGRILELRYSY